MSEDAIRNARAWLADIVADVAAYNAVQNDKEWGRADELREAMQEKPLSVQVRDGWRSPGEDRSEPEEYEILLSTGGPALRIYGQLGAHGQPDDSPHLQWQDWGTPWTDLPMTADEESALQDFACAFYFGEG